MHQAVLNRYAKAFVDSTKTQSFDVGLAQLKTVNGLVQASMELRQFLESPVIAAELKKEVLDEMSKRLNVDSIVANFLKVLVDGRRIMRLANVIERMEAIQDETQRIQNAFFKII